MNFVQTDWYCVLQGIKLDQRLWRLYLEESYWSSRNYSRHFVCLPPKCFMTSLPERKGFHLLCVLLIIDFLNFPQTDIFSPAKYIDSNVIK